MHNICEAVYPDWVFAYCAQFCRYIQALFLPVWQVVPATYVDLFSKTVFFSVSGVEFGKSEQQVIRHRDNTSARRVCRYFCVRCFIEISFFRDVVSISNFEVTIPLLFEKNMNEV